METCGGARVDWDAKSFVVCVSAGDSAICASTVGAEIDASDVRGWANWDVVTARL